MRPDNAKELIKNVPFSNPVSKTREFAPPFAHCEVVRYLFYLFIIFLKFQFDTEQSIFSHNIILIECISFALKKTLMLAKNGQWSSLPISA